MASTKTKDPLGDLAGLKVVKAEDTEGFIKCLVYGDPGAGKTWFAASAEDIPSMRPVLMIDMEGGIVSVKKRWPGIHVVRVEDTYKTDKEGNTRIDPVTGQPVVERHAWEHLYDLYEHLKTKPHPYKTIILDSVTEAYAICMRWVMYLLIHGSSHSKPKPNRDPDIADKREYAKARSRVHLMMRSFRDLKAHVVMTALKDVKTNNDTGAIINYIPGLPGKLAYEVGAFMDQLHYLYPESTKDGMVRYMLTQPLNKYLAKDRSDSLPTVVENPTMKTLTEAILGKEDEDGKKK